MAGLMDMIGQPTNIWGMINRLPSLFGQQEPPKRIDQPQKSQAPQKRDFSFAKDFIQQKGVEGRKNKYYWDAAAFEGEGAITSGVGHLVPHTRGKEIYKQKLEGIPLKEKDVEKQYEKDLQEHGNAGRDFFGREAFDKLPENVQTVLTSLAFNVGPSNIKDYTRMKEAVENFDKESFVDSKGNSRDGGIAGISEELIYSNYNKKPNTFSPRFNTTGGRTGMEIMHMLNPSPTIHQQPQIPPPQPPMQPQMLVADKSGMYPPPKRQMQPQAQMQPQQMQPSLQQIAHTAQAQPVLNPFPWLKEVSGSYSHPSPPDGKWV